MATGARPVKLPGVTAGLAGQILTLRDTDSVEKLAAHLEHARSVAVIGNGGIALELVCVGRGIHVL